VEARPRTVISSVGSEDLTVVAVASFIPYFGPGVFSVRAALSCLSAQALVDILL